MKKTNNLAPSIIASAFLIAIGIAIGLSHVPIPKPDFNVQISNGTTTVKERAYVYWIDKDKWGLLPHCGDGSEKVGTCDFSCAPEGWCVFIPNKEFSADEITKYIK
mgnify:FL=1